ncbi:hypothetical protein GGR54DRAFT_265341 [Hypoxylon sp. NC1633]|nr:hypothetical protein GGR54DRAFT_265341 [Hypoxylon sp. NC1633]
MMNATKATTKGPLGTSPANASTKEEWEDWDDSDDEMRKMTEDKDGLLIDIWNETGQKQAPRPITTKTVSRSAPRYSIQKPVRLKSRHRQKAQNAKAGIRLVTDMSAFYRPVKFVNAAALHALEGQPSSASIGSFSWLKRKPGNMSGYKPSNKSLRGISSDLSPAARPIVIGIALPSDNVSNHQVSPQTAVIETPIEPRNPPQKPTAASGNPPALTPQQLRSVWSPDTEASQSPYLASRAASSIYSQPSMYGGPVVDTDVPPVPQLPAKLQFKQTQAIGFDDPEDDDVGTPCTLFEEDGSPTATRKSAKPKAPVVSPESASSRSHGWWDHVTTPFLQQSNPFKQQAQETAPTSPQQWNPFKKQVQAGPSPVPPATPTREWWAGVDEKGDPSQPIPSKQQVREVAPTPTVSLAAHREWRDGVDREEKSLSNAPGLAMNAPIALQQQRTAQSVDVSSRSVSPARVETRSRKANVLVKEKPESREEPPAYSAPKTVNQVKYGVVLPPAQTVSTQRVPSPGPMTPGLPGTMTSQGAVGMTDIPLTPSYKIQGQANSTERQRRRHEKEEAVARKAGGFWRGRGCVPSKGCFGRTGREGRKRRRVCLGVIILIILLIILAIVLAILFTRPKPAEESQPFSIWLNLTDFPPMPTGALTVAGPNNLLAKSGCLTLTAATAWSCTLPKEAHASVAPNAPNQPQFIFQIQYDNNTRALWNVTNEENSNGGQGFLADAGFKPNPEPPSIAEMRFLGTTTDHIQAEDKAGEPTPFFISLLKSVNDTIGPNILTDILPPPTLNGDGTGAQARLFPLPTQQPVRLFDRGLPTEHYGFYSYFDKTIYMVDTVKANPADEDGGALETEAKSIVTFAQTRFLVQIWTRLENSSLLLGDNSGTAVPWTNGTASASAPGTMPYPVTVTVDMHGGDRLKKIDFRYGVDANQQINTTDAQLILSNRGFNGTLVNGLNNNPNLNLSLGGIDGGTGGCKCEWINFKGIGSGTQGAGN